MIYKRSIIYLVFFSILLSIDPRENIRYIFFNKQREILLEDANFNTYTLGLNSTSKLEEYFLYTDRELVIKSTSPWLKNNLIDIDDVLNYVLPYQINNSLDLTWRAGARLPLVIKADHNEYSLQKFLSFCDIINDSIQGKILFQRTSLDENFMSYADLQRIRKGTCIAMTDYTNYTFRALGIPVTTDFTPAWGNLNGGSHAWNVLLLKDKNIPFMGTESHIKGYNPILLSESALYDVTAVRIPPKVYRKSRYDLNSFVFFKEKVIDVTEEYVEVRDIVIKNKEQLPQVYLATFTNGKYTINSIGTVKEKDVFFGKMAKGLVYFPVAVINNNIKPIDYPIICDKNINKIASPNFDSLININIEFLQSFEDAQFEYIKKYGYNIKDERIFFSDTIRSTPFDGEEYELYFWDMKWNLAKKHRAINKKLTFTDIPSNAIYLVKQREENISKKRIFAISNNSLSWF